jgi:uncharacterized lipoprotein YajG
MKSIALLLLATGALALAGCSSTPTTVDTGPIHARTFSFVNPGARQALEGTDNTQAVHQMIQAAITKNFAARGISKADSGGDVTVAYLVIVGNNVSTTAVGDYFSQSEDATALQDELSKAYTNNKNPNYFEAGTLIIDVIDSKTYKLLKRGYASRQILQNPSTQARAERIQGVVDQILASLRVES